MRTHDWRGGGPLLFGMGWLQRWHGPLGLLHTTTTTTTTIIITTPTSHTPHPQERRAHAMRHARTGAFGDVGRIGPVDNIQLQREMRRRALLEQMKNNAWAGSFAPQREPGPGPAGGDA